MSEPFVAEPDSIEPDSIEPDSIEPESIDRDSADLHGASHHGAPDDGAPDDGVGQYADSRPSGDPHPEPDALLGRLRVIEDQPLEARAAAFGQLHDELRAILEAGQIAPQHHD